MREIKELIIIFISLIVFQYFCIFFLKEIPHVFFTGYLSYPFIKFLTSNK